MPSKLPSYTGPVEEQQAATGRAALQSLREYLADRGAALPEGFEASVHLRKEGSPGAVDIYYFDHLHTRYRSKLQVARALGVADSRDRDEGASLPSSPRVMGVSPSSPAAADAAGQQLAAHHLQLPAHADQGGDFVGSEEEVKVMEALSKYLAKLGGQLEPGWRCQVRKRAGPGNRVDTYFNSPNGEKFRSKTDVARHLGLAVPAARRPAGGAASPGVDVNMAEEDVAAMLMALPHGKPITAREAARARKVSGAVAGEWAGRAKGPGTPDNAAGRSGNGLHSIAAALEEASPFQVKQEGAAYADDEQMFDSDDEDTDTRADEKAELAARQMRRLRAAAHAQGLTLAPGWRVDVSIRKNGTSRGSTDYYYRLQGGGTFRSITAAMKHLLAAEHGAAPAVATDAPMLSPASEPAADPASPQLPQQERPPSPASAARAAPGSPADNGGPAGPSAKPKPKKFGSLTALSHPGRSGAAVARPTSPSDSVAKGKNPAPEEPSSAARPTTKAALAALGRDATASGHAPEKQEAAEADRAGLEAGAADAAAESNMPGPSGMGSVDEAGAAVEGNASEPDQAGHNESNARMRQRKPNRNAMAPKDEPAEKTGPAPAARKRRTVNRGRVDYATVAAMADLQYAISNEDRRATLRKRNAAKSGTPEATATNPPSTGVDKDAAQSTAEGSEPAKGRSQGASGAAGKGEEGEQKPKKAERKRERVVTPYTKLVNRVRGLISRIRVEEAYLDAYEGEGWRGANREKLRPTAELEQARLQIEKCKLGMREAVKECEESGGDRAIPPEHIDEDGEIDEAHIFCGHCHDPESYEDNDIILCDGNCHRAYHEKCLVPPLDSSTLPEDEGWLCPACDAKADILTMINEEYGFEYEQETPWHAVFAEAPMSPRAAADGAAAAPVTFKTLADFLAHADLPDSDADDSSFKDESGSDGEEGEEAHGGGSGSDGESESGSEADSVDSEASEGSSVESMASEERKGLQAEEAAAGEGRPQRKLRSAGKRARGNADEVADVDADMGADVDDDDEEESLVLSGKRARTTVDYRKLNMEMFGDFESYEGETLSDEDFTPREAEAEAAAASPASP